MTKLLVTGADGFIGSHLTEAPVRKGHDVRAFVLYNSFNSLGSFECFPMISTFGSSALSRRSWVLRQKATFPAPQRFLVIIQSDDWGRASRFWARGNSARLLAENDIAYLASITSEYNFALACSKSGDDRLRSPTEQAEWLSRGIELFKSTFALHR